MVVIRRTAFVKFSTCEMYNLVNDIGSYPKFLPMCSKVDVHLQSTTEIEATLSIVKGSIKIDFATHNDIIKDQKITMRLIKGPFKCLNGSWRFFPLKNNSSRVNLDLKFDFSNKIFGIALGFIFENLANNMLDIFCNRAQEIYGVCIHKN